MSTRTALRSLALVAFAGAILAGSGVADAASNKKPQTPPAPPAISRQAPPAPPAWQPPYPPPWGMPQPQPLQQPALRPR